jgi:hypothetical protein
MLSLVFSPGSSLPTNHRQVWDVPSRRLVTVHQPSERVFTRLQS